MVEIGEEMNDRELNEMIKATGTLDGKGLFSWSCWVMLRVCTRSTLVFWPEVQTMFYAMLAIKIWDFQNPWTLRSIAAWAILVLWVRDILILRSNKVENINKSILNNSAQSWVQQHPKSSSSPINTLQKILKLCLLSSFWPQSMKVDLIWPRLTFAIDDFASFYLTASNYEEINYSK